MAGIKTLQFVLVMIVIFSFLALNASAALEFQEEKLILDVDYNKFQLEDQDDISLTGSLTLKNSGTANQNVNIIFNAPTSYTTSPINNVAVEAGASKTVTYTIKVPHQQDAGDATIGSVEAKDSTSNTVLASRPIVQKTKSMLVLRELQVKYTKEDGTVQDEEFGSAETKISLDDGAKPGTEVHLTFTLENLFDRDYDNDNSLLEDLELQITPDDNDLIAGNFEEEYSLDEIEAREKQTFPVSFTISDTIDSGDYTLEITITGEDGKGFNHKIERELTLKVERADDDVRIVKTELVPATVSCEDKFIVNVEVQNFGTRDQDYTSITIFNEKLGIKETIPEFKLPRYSKSDSKSLRSFVFATPKKIEAGTYPTDVTVSIKKNIRADSTVLPIVISKCGLPSSPAGKETTPATPPSIGQTTAAAIAPSATNTAVEKAAAGSQDSKSGEADQNKVTSSTIVKSIEDPYTEDDLASAFLIVGIIIVLAFITWFIVLLFK